MYGVILATALTVGGAGTGWGCHGCHGCNGCYGYAFSNCYGCSCYGCYGHSCFGCYGSCFGCYGCSCYGCFGNCYGCYGATYYGCYGSCYGCYASYAVAYAPVVYVYPASCYGCYGSTILPPAVAPAKALQPPPETVPPPPKKTAPTAAPAQVTVRLPADAKLFVDGVACPLTSDTRSFATPALQPGQRYFYTMRVELVRDGVTQSDSQRVVLEAGQASNVTFPTAATATASIKR